MLDKNGFDIWANDYEKAVKSCKNSGIYPFAGYDEVLDAICKRIGRSKTVLDIGFGTGMLTKKLYDNGCKICGFDFSDSMIEIAQEKMSDALLIQGDFSQGLPIKFKNLEFDYAVCTYAIHHITDTRKVVLINEVAEHLSPGGKFFIGDVSFKTRDEMLECREMSIDTWDDAEHYIVFDELKPYIRTASFEKISFCAGITTCE